MQHACPPSLYAACMPSLTLCSMHARPHSMQHTCPPSFYAACMHACYTHTQSAPAPLTAYPPSLKQALKPEARGSAFLSGDSRNFKIMPRPAGRSIFLRKLRKVTWDPRDFWCILGSPTNLYISFSFKKNDVAAQKSTGQETYRVWPRQFLGL